MNEFDNRMREALCRREPPAGFAERVIARAERKSRRWEWMAVAAAAMLLVTFGVQRQVEQRRAEEAREQAIMALRITAEKLNVVQTRLAARANRAETEIP